MILKMIEVNEKHTKALNAINRRIQEHEKMLETNPVTEKTYLKTLKDLLNLENEKLFILNSQRKILEEILSIPDYK